MKLGTVMLYIGEASVQECGEWYQRVLGFDVSDQGSSVWFGGDDAAGVGLHAGHVIAPEHSVELYFTVADIDAEADRLTKLGVEFDGPEEMSWGTRTLHLHDPAGNAVWLMAPTN